MLALSYLSAVVGAGFASGREAFQFFARHGPRGFAGAIVAATVFALGGCMAVTLQERSRASDLKALLSRVLGRQADLGEAVLYAFAFATLGVLVAALRSLLAWSPVVGLLVLLSVGALVDRGRRAAQAVQVPLIALLVASLLMVTAQHLGDPSPLLPAAAGWLGSAVEYGAYNLVLSLPLLLLAGRHEPFRRRLLAVVLAAAVFAGLIVMLVLVLLPHRIEWSRESLPMLKAALKGGAALHALYWCGLLAATLSAVLGYLVVLTERLSQILSRPRWLPYGILGAALPLSNLGVVHLVAAIYPIMGVASAGFVLLLAWRLTTSYGGRER
jgi:uncharacterized membrane protein YkvI